MPGFIALVLAVLTQQNVRFLVMLSMFKDQNHKFQYFLCLWTSNSGKIGIFGVILTLPKLVSKFEGLKT